jgi:DNA-binding transcriptional ArsR family regulator
VSRHLAVLRDAGLISAERNGNSIQYELNATVIQDLVAHIFDWTKKGGGNA